jgi:hypothetical protein
MPEDPTKVVLDAPPEKVETPSELDRFEKVQAEPELTDTGLVKDMLLTPEDLAAFEIELKGEKPPEEKEPEPPPAKLPDEDVAAGKVPSKETPEVKVPETEKKPVTEELRFKEVKITFKANGEERAKTLRGEFSPETRREIERLYTLSEGLEPKLSKANNELHQATEQLKVTKERNAKLVEHHALQAEADEPLKHHLDLIRESPRARFLLENDPETNKLLNQKGAYSAVDYNYENTMLKKKNERLEGQASLAEYNEVARSSWAEFALENNLSEEEGLAVVQNAGERKLIQYHKDPETGKLLSPEEMRKAWKQDYEAALGLAVHAGKIKPKSVIDANAAAAKAKAEADRIKTATTSLMSDKRTVLGAPGMSGDGTLKKTPYKKGETDFEHTQRLLNENPEWEKEIARDLAMSQ